MGNYINNLCCIDKGILVTYENISSKLSSPSNHEFQRIIIGFPESIKAIEHLEECQTPNEKPRMIRRTLSSIGEIEKSTNFVRSFKRSLTIKTNETFLRKAKRRISMLKDDSDETPKTSELNSGFKNKVLEFGWHLDIPNGDRDLVIE